MPNIFEVLTQKIDSIINNQENQDTLTNALDRLNMGQMREVRKDKDVADTLKNLDEFQNAQENYLNFISQNRTLLVEYSREFATINNKIRSGTDNMKVLRRELNRTNDTRKKREIQQRINDQYDKNLRLINERNDIKNIYQKDIESKYKNYNFNQQQIDDANNLANDSRKMKALNRVILNTEKNSLVDQRKEQYQEQQGRRARNLVSGLDNNLLGKVTDTLEKFGYLTGAIAGLLDKMGKMSDIFVQFNREMSQGVMSSQQLYGSDLYGNTFSSEFGNIKSYLESQNLDIKEFIQSGLSFSQGNTFGSSFKDLENQQVSLIKLGTNFSKLVKNYGVDAGVLNEITKNLFYQYGLSVSEINTTLTSGADLAKQNGVALKTFYANLAEASSMVGKHFIAGGADGLNKIAIAATKLNVSIADMFNYADRFKNFTSQFDEQAMAMSLGLSNYSRASRTTWALDRVGRTDEAFSLANAELTKDFSAMNMFDQFGNLNRAGMDTAKAMNLSEDQIKLIQRLNKQFGDLGGRFTVEEIAGIKKVTGARAEELEMYQKTNRTVSERFQVIGAKFYQAIEPIINMFMPLIDAGIDLLEVLGSVAGFVGKVLSPIFNTMGYWAKKVGDGFKFVTTKFNEFLDKFNMGDLFSDKKDENGQPVRPSLLENSISTLGLGGALLGIGKMAGSSNPLVGGLGKMFNFLPATMARMVPGASALGTAGWGKSMMGGALKGGGISLAGQLLGMSAGGQAGDSLSTVASYAGTGALIGSVIPGIGTAIGGAVGAIIGVGADAWDEIEGVWNDGSKTGWEKFFGIIDAIGKSIGRVLIGIAQGITNALITAINWILPEKNEIEKVDWVKDGSAFAKQVGDATYKGVYDANIDLAAKNRLGAEIQSSLLNNSRDYYKEINKMVLDRRKTVDEGQATAERAEKRRKEVINVKVENKTSIFGAGLKTQLAAGL